MTHMTLPRLAPSRLSFTLLLAAWLASGSDGARAAPAFGGPMISFCDPGTGPVQACPCANMPSGALRGCDNSSFTGGASLDANGVASTDPLLDTLVFTTTNELPQAASAVMQGTVPIASGLVFGQGLRCVGGQLKRLYVKLAVGGSISAPMLGDPSVSARSAALGDVLLPSATRYYFVYYRDPWVLNFCPATSTFNSTQAGQIDWQ